MSVSEILAPPKDAVFGERLDADGHVYPEPDLMRDILGDLGRDPISDYIASYFDSDEDKASRAQNREDIWSVKGISALGASFSRAEERVEAIEMMGLRSQLVFQNTFGKELRVDSPAARAACRRYNDVALAWGAQTGGRARVACMINMGDIAWALEEVDRVIRGGAKLVTLPCAAPPAGLSPAHSAWDPFWRRLEEADVAVTLHLGGGGMLSGQEPDPILPAREWGQAETLKGSPASRPGGEEAISPYFMLVAHMPAELYLQILVMGGVFERFPRLRFGIIEYGSGWVGPCVERMDLWTGFLAKVGRSYPMKPSEYVRRNVRVAPFYHENLPLMIERYGMEEIYVFSTDYPHLEGSRDPIGKFQKWLDRLDPGYARKFFVENGALLFPGL
jgi:predicted TIM-barrel fold metal-dependent hydrolase